MSSSNAFLGQASGRAATSRRRIPWRLIVGLLTFAGLLSALRLGLTYPWLGVQISAVDAIGSGIMDWWSWLPFVALCFWLAEHAHAVRWPAWRLVAFHACAGVAISFCHLSFFSAVSGVVRTLRFGDAFVVAFASPMLWMLAPGTFVYGIFVIGWWWHQSRSAPAPTSANERVESAEQDPPLAFRSGRGQLLLTADQIDWIRSAGNYLELHVGETTHLVRETLTSAHHRLGEERFVRIHRSTLVRRTAISAIDDRVDGAVILRDGTRLVVGKTHRERLLREGRA